MKKGKRGLASADEKTRQRVGRLGGTAKHTVRGLQAASKQVRQRVARMGGKA
ncbi:MAG TPA: hypothetical protein VF189_05140 [Patescibacteria group bacterium]